MAIRCSVLAAGLVAFIAVLPALVAGARIKDPPVLRCSDGNLSLTIKAANISVGNFTWFSPGLYHYNDEPLLPGPTLVMRAGEQCSLTVVNMLGSESDNSSSTDCDFSNSFHCPFETNLYVFGLFASPMETDVSRAIAPGANWTYTFNVPMEHLMGTLWYGAHKHGASALQIVGGLFGAAIMEPSIAWSLPSDLDVLYRNDSDRKHWQLLVLNHIELNKRSNNSDSNSTNSSSRDSPRSFDQLLDEFDIENRNSEDSFNNYLVNGMFQPTVDLFVNDTMLLRFVHVSSGRSVILDFGESCTAYLVARDSVFQGLPWLFNRYLTLAPGSRADVAIWCTEAGVVDVNAVDAEAANFSSCFSGNTFTQERVFIMNVSSFPRMEDNGTDSNSTDSNSTNSTNMEIPLPTSSVTLPSYLMDLRNMTAYSLLLNQSIDGNWTLVNVTRFVFGMRSEEDDNSSDIRDLFWVNNISFRGWDADLNSRYIGVGKEGVVYEVMLGDESSMSSAFEPVHFHTFKMQIQSDDMCGGLIWRQGEWRDIVPQSGLMIRWLPWRFSGDILFHSSIFEHADLGAAALYKICNSSETSDVCPEQLQEQESVFDCSWSSFIVRWFNTLDLQSLAPGELETAVRFIINQTDSALFAPLIAEAANLKGPSDCFNPELKTVLSAAGFDWTVLVNLLELLRDQVDRILPGGLPDIPDLPTNLPNIPSIDVPSIVIPGTNIRLPNFTIPGIITPDVDVSDLPALIWAQLQGIMEDFRSNANCVFDKAGLGTL